MEKVKPTSPAANLQSETVICPICGEALHFNEREAYCDNRHHFDKARQGYVNLLMKNGSGEKRHGDDSLMLKARQEFLEKGYYDPLAELIAAAVQRYAQEKVVVADIGCGEGYYAEKISRALTESGRDAEMICIDISKEAAKRTAKRSFAKTALVASAFELPIRRESCDIAVSIFAPFSEKELLRILKQDGIFIQAVPRERHLFGLKAEIYDEPYENPAVKTELEGFELLGCETLDSELLLDNGTDIENLFKMTPYYYKTSAEGQQRAAALQKLRTEIAFAVMVYRKKGNI